MERCRKVLIQVLIVSLIGLASVVGVWLLLSRGASADADISVSKTADPTSLPAPGGTVTFTVRVDNNSGTGVVTLTLLTDDVYGDLDDKGNCVLTQTILAGGYYSCAFTGIVSSTVAGDVMTDVVTAVAEGDGGPTDTVTETATATVSITAGPLHHIVIEDAADGAGSAVTTHAMTADQTFQVWAAGYDAYNNYIEDVSVGWSGTGVVAGRLSPTSGISTTFTAGEAGTGTIEANDGSGHEDGTETITVNPGALDHIVICTDDSGQNPAGSHAMTTDDTWTLYAAGYDADNNFIANQTATWDETGTLNNVSASGVSYPFSPSTADTSGTINADAGGGMTDATGTITVNPGALDHIVICTDANGQNPAGSHTMTTDDTWTLWAAGYDAEDNFRGNETATWDQTGTLDDVSASGTSYTFSPSTAGTSGTITADADGKSDGTGTIVVNIGVLHHIVIEDAADGTGSEVGTHTMIAGETFQVWAAGYDTEHNYIGDISVAWSGTGVVAGRLAPASGISTTFTAGETVTGTIHADHPTATDDDTGTITVNPAALSYIVIEDTAGGTGSEVGTHTMASGQTFQVWAAGYDAYDNYIGDVTATWSGTGVVAGRLAPTSGSSTIFTAGETGTGTIHADDGSGHTDDTGTIMVSDLTVSKIGLPEIVPAGEELTYIINYQNGVTSHAEEVIITETYDSRVTFVSATLTPTMGTNNVWDIGDLYVGQSGSIVVTVRVNTPLADGTILTNRVTIDSLHTSPLTYVVTTSVSAPDLVIAAAHEPSIFSPGKLMTYTLTYSNTGRWQAEGVIITTTLPPGTTYAGQEDWISSDDQTYIYVVGDLPADDASDQAYFVVRYADQPQIGAVEFNTCFTISESGSAGDASQDNNTICVYIGVPDLIVTDCTVEPWPLQADVPVTFTIVLENQGTGMAWNPDVETGFFVDVFIAPVVSYPFVRWSEKNIYDIVPPLGPGLQHTLDITLTGPYLEDRERIQFSEQEVEEIDKFYCKVDNFAEEMFDERGNSIGWTRLYGIVPESNEMNNIYPPWSDYVYLPLVFR